MEEFNISRVIPTFENKEINECVKNVSVSLYSENHMVGRLIENVCNLRKLLKGRSTCSIAEDSESIQEKNILKIKYDFYDITTKIFGFKKRTIQKILTCEMFLGYELPSTKISLLSCFRNFSLTKLFELFPLKEKAVEYVREGYITSEYTVQELRLKVQELLGKEVIRKDKNTNDFDLNEEYTLNDFKTRWTKTGLIDIAFSLYTNYRGYLLGKKGK